MNETGKPVLNLALAVKNLDAGQKPLWGKMTAQHMVEHLVGTIMISNGKRTIRVFTDEKQIPAMRRFIFSEKSWPQNLVTAANKEELLPLRAPDLDTARDKLFAEIEEYYNFFAKNPDASPVNPVVGSLNFDEWELFHQKHFTHHLKQFGLK